MPYPGSRKSKQQQVTQVTKVAKRPGNGRKNGPARQEKKKKPAKLPSLKNQIRAVERLLNKV